MKLTLPTNQSLSRTAGYYLLFASLGLDTAILGPALPALAKQTGTDLGGIGLVFLLGSIGYTLGTTVGGRLFDRQPGHPILGLAQLVVAAILVMVPFAPSLWLLLALLVCKGFAEGLVNTGANTLLVWTHEDRAGPYVNGLHFCFGLGAFLAPFVFAPLLGTAGGYRWAYWALAVCALLAALPMLWLRTSPQPVRTGPQPVRHSAETQAKSGGMRAYLPVAIVAALFLFFYVGAEITFGQWIYTYAVTLGLADAVAAARLTSAFWLSFSIGRLLSIPVAVRFKPHKILWAALSGCLFFLAVALLLPNRGSILWGVALGLGFCMAPIWPTGYTLAGQSVRLTAQASSIILLGDSFGGMVLPTATGRVIEQAGPGAMLYLVLASVVGTLLSFVGMLRLRRDAAAREPAAP